jgi:hypothetical protein
LENALIARPPEMAWDLTLDSTEDILARLRDADVLMDHDTFAIQARRTGSPTALADLWVATDRGGDAALASPTEIDSRPKARREALFSAAAFELWKRWLPEVSCADILAEEFDRQYEPLDVLMFGSPAAVRDALARAHRIADAVAPPDGPVNHELFEEIWSRTYHDLALWLRCLPQVLSHRELFDEAIALCERLAPIFDARAFLSDKALLLAQCGRSGEARLQVTANVRRWRRDPTIMKKSCETLWALGNSEEALLLYDEVLESLSRTRRPEIAPGPGGDSREEIP